MKLRIVEIKNENGSGIVEINFEIQRKFLNLFWISCPFKTIKKSLFNLNGANIINKYYYFKTFDKAREALYKIKKQKTTNYKGNKIITVFEYNDLKKEAYVNLSKVVDAKHVYSPSYEFSHDLDDLKNEIDRRINKKSTRVVKIFD